MDMRELTIMPREGLGKGEAKRLRRAGRTPGILYGGAAPVPIAVHPVGDAVGVRETQGILEMVLREIQVSCLPGNIPEAIEADVSNLAIGDVLTVGDLPIPDGVRVLTDRAQAVATVAPPAAEEVAPVAAVEAVAAAPAEPEVLTERKPKEEPEAVDDKAKKK